MRRLIYPTRDKQNVGRPSQEETEKTRFAVLMPCGLKNIQSSAPSKVAGLRLLQRFEIETFETAKQLDNSTLNFNRAALRTFIHFTSENFN